MALKNLPISREVFNGKISFDYFKRLSIAAAKFASG